MPESKLENFVFTVMMAFVMVYAMVCYNIALTNGGMKDAVLLEAFREMMIMWPVAIILEMFIFEKPVVYLTRRVMTPSTQKASQTGRFFSSCFFFLFPIRHTCRFADSSLLLCIEKQCIF